jgi:O-antigen ligase
MAILLSAIAALLPLIITPRLLFYYDITPKIVVLLLGMAIAPFVAWRAERAQSAGLRILGLLLVAQAVSLAISTAFSTDAALSLGGGTWRRFGLITQYAMLLFAWFVAQHTAGNTDRARQFLRVVSAAGIPAAIYGISQYFGWDPWISPSEYHIGEAPLTIVRPPGALGYVSYFATYLLSVIFAGAALVMIEESRAWKFLGAAAGVLSTAALILTGTRAATLGLGCGGVFLMVWLRPRMRSSAMAAGLAALAALAGFYLSPAGQLLRSRTRWFIEDPLGGGRTLLWRDSVRMAAARWPVGFGPETFSTQFPPYQSAQLARAYPDYYQESPHNIFIDALAGQGVLGFVALLGLATLGFYAVWMMRNRKLAAALGAAMIATLVSQQFTSFTLPTALFFYITIALLVGQAFLPVSRPPNMYSLGTLASLGVLSVLFITFALALLVADAALAGVDRLIRAGKLREAAAIYQHAEPRQPPGMRTDLWYSRAIAGAARGQRNPADAIAAWQQGLTAAVRAARNAEDRQNAWLNLAVFYGRQNDFPHTEQSLRAAIASAPNGYKPHWLLAQVLRVGGRLPEARAEASLAAYLNGGKDPEVARIAAQILETPKISQK